MQPPPTIYQQSFECQLSDFDPKYSKIYKGYINDWFSIYFNSPQNKVQNTPLILLII